jgi:hypothetical protein
MMDVGSDVRILVACTIARNDGELPPSPYLNDPSSPSGAPKVRACAGAVCDATSGPMAAGSKIVSFLLIESARDRGGGISSLDGLAEPQNPKPVQLARLALRLCFSVPRSKARQTLFSTNRSDVPEFGFRTIILDPFSLGSSTRLPVVLILGVLDARATASAEDLRVGVGDVSAIFVDRASSSRSLTDMDCYPLSDHVLGEKRRRLT